MRFRRLLSLVALACAFTLLNAFKPLHIDDTAYCCYAHQIARHPLDPYGFEIHWYDLPKPAHEVLAPPVLPYWWAAGVALFGERPFLWKLWLLPFGLLLVFALHRLLRLYARGLEMPLLWMTVLSPTLLPSFNLMLDVPALALGLGALAVFSRAAARRSWSRALLAGLLAGLAMETKYSALLVPAALLLYALLYRRLRFGIGAAGVAVLFFVGCEAMIASRYGMSHFLLHLQRGPDSLERPFNLVMPLVGILGATASAVGLLGLAALGARRWVLVSTGLGLAALLGLLAIVPTADASFFRDAETHKGRLTLNNLAVGPAGLLVIGVVAASAWQLLRLSRRGNHWCRADLFPVVWLLLELAAYFALTPFPATRRVLGIVVAATVVVGRLAVRSRRLPDFSWNVRGVATAGAALGLAWFTVDFYDARAEKDAVAGAARWIRRQEADARIWYAGHWGFQFYAERIGLLPVLPLDARPRPGEWLIRPDTRVTQQPWYDGEGRIDAVTTLRRFDWLPLRTVPGYYGGNTPLEHHEGPRIAVTIYRVR